MTDLATMLGEASRRDRSDPVEMTIRSLLDRWGAKRRGYWIVDKINRELVEAGLTTHPPFTEGWIDNVVRIVPYDKPGPAMETEPSSADAAGVGPDSQVMLRVGDLSSSNTGVVGVAPDAELDLVQSLMLRHDFSQVRFFRAATSREP